MADGKPAAANGASTIGVLGGGQLGRMMGLAGLPMGLRFRFLDPAPDACAAATGGLLQAGFDDESAAARLAEQVDVVTFDFENVPESTAAAVSRICPVFPPPLALAAAQDRLNEKDLMRQLHIAVPDYHAVSSRTDLLAGLDRLSYPAVLKTRRLGYDGKGQAVLHDQEDLERAWQKIGGSDLILEAFVPFEAECSLVGVRGQDGETRFWPLTRNVHHDGILLLSLPGVFGDALQQEAESIMNRLLEHFDYVGVLTIEFFVMDGRLMVNEIAPRVHNSGHWTIDGAACSQFENHIRAVAGLPLGATGMTANSIMFNWIGTLPSRQAALAVEGLHWHDYGKAPRAGRKIGHATLTANSGEELEKRAYRLAEIAGPVFGPFLDSIFDQV